ncbi:MAG TPA: hypothetical protein VGJ22_06825 [Anaerolineales bacterium]
MKKRRIGLLFILVTLMGSLATPAQGRAAAPNPPPGPDRFTVITVNYTAFTWWMATWRGSEVVCSVVVDHEDAPTPDEIYRDCGGVIYDDWLAQDPCIKKKPSTCDGYYIYPVSSEVIEKEIPTHLPEASAWLTLEDCVPVVSLSTNICEAIPKLVITGQEPLPNETIIGVEGTLDGEPFYCEEAVCKLPLQPTDEDGAALELWAWSSYGDSSPVFTGQVRVVQADEGDPDQLYWYVDVLSSQWQGEPLATCAESWQSFPPVGGPPEWLSTPLQSEELSSDIPYTYLAANLILQGAVDARACVDGGLIPGGGVNTCGLEASRPVVVEWQNRFDSLIFNTSQASGVPARLLKNLFARESQFWPGIFRATGDVGLGQLTENGADTTMIWNPSFFNQFCPLVLPSEDCGKGYFHLDEDQQLLLRQGLISSVNATCSDCPLGLDLTQADFSVNVFAHTLLANCEQAGRVVRNLTGTAPGDTASYEDLWKFTLVNYNAGPGCLGDAIEGALGQGRALTWPDVSSFLPEACAAAIDYVNDISQ